MTTPNFGIDYGYQWLIWEFPTKSFGAQGSGGQQIMVVPELDIVAVFTGGLLGDAQNLPVVATQQFVVPAALTADPLPENPDQLAELAASIEDFAQPQARPVAPLPEMAQQVSAVTYTLGDNPLGWQSFMLTFDDGDEAQLQMTMADGELTVPVGLDDVYRVSQVEPLDFLGAVSSEPSVGLKGRWRSDTTFLVDFQLAGAVEKMLIRLNFAGDRVTARLSFEPRGQSFEIQGAVRE
jgi:hypothetical protein